MLASMRFGFGESVLWQMAPDKNNRDKLNGDFHDGLFLGVIWKTTEFIIGTPEGIFKCQTVKQRPEESCYDPACIDDMITTYNDYVLSGAKSKGAKLRFADPSVGVVPSTPVARAGNEWAPRRIYLKQPDFEKHGYTVECMGCRWMQTGLGAKRGHGEQCRARMEEAMASNEEDRDRLEAQKTKIDAYVAAEGEAAHSGEQEGKVEAKEPDHDGEAQDAAMEKDLDDGPKLSRDVRLAEPAAIQSPVRLDDQRQKSTETRVRTPTTSAAKQDAALKANDPHAARRAGKRGAEKIPDEGPDRKGVIFETEPVNPTASSSSGAIWHDMTQTDTPPPKRQNRDTDDERGVGHDMFVDASEPFTSAQGSATVNPSSVVAFDAAGNV